MSLIYGKPPWPGGPHSQQLTLISCLDLAVPKDRAHRCGRDLSSARTRSRVCRPPTVIDELDYIAQHGDTVKERALAVYALQNLVRVWKIPPLDFIPVGHGIIETVARKLRRPTLIPENEVNDSFILAEAAWLISTILITSE